MRSFTSSFRWLLGALAIIAAVEIATWTIVKPSRFNMSTLLQHNFLSGENAHRVIVMDKLNHLLDQPADVVFVGDSSGYHGIDPRVFEAETGLQAVNLNCCNATTRRGQIEIADLALGRTDARYLVYYSTPPTLSGDENSEWESFADALEALSLRPALPSLALREPLSQQLFPDYRTINVSNWAVEEKREAVRANLRRARGYEPVFATMPFERASAYLEPYCASYTGGIPINAKHLKELVEGIARVSRKHNARAAIILNTWPCDGVKGYANPYEAHALFANYADVLLPVDLTLTPQDPQEFADIKHLREELVDANTRRVAATLLAAIRQSETHR